MDSVDVEDRMRPDISSKEIEHATVHETPSFSAEEEKALVRTIDMTLLPIYRIKSVIE